MIKMTGIIFMFIHSERAGFFKILLKQILIIINASIIYAK